MKRGKYETPYVAKRNSSKKALAMLLSLVLVIGCVVGGTVAWLTAQDTSVVNKFSPSTIGVELKENTTEYKMIPGWDIAKDPKAWVTDGSEAAYLFVDIKESANFDTFMTYAIADGWTLLNSDPVKEGSDIVTDDTTAGTYVIYRKVTTADQMGENNAFAILKDNKVTVIGEGVTAEMMNALKADDPTTEENESTYPTLTFTAYAHQLYKSKDVPFDVATAWGNLSNQ